MSALEEMTPYTQCNKVKKLLLEYLFAFAVLATAAIIICKPEFLRLIMPASVGPAL